MQKNQELSAVQTLYLERISEYLRVFTDSLYGEKYGELNEVFYYHLGLRDSLEKQGKRIRPLLTLMCATGAGIPSEKAIPAAGAIELIHNFSLIHDDIEDNGLVRRGKEAVWKKWGLSQGLNAGDAMFNAAFTALQDLREYFSAEIFFEAAKLLTDTCGDLTKGQFLDIGFENREDVSTEEYIEMVEGKTGALLSCSTEMGAVLAGRGKEQREYFRNFGLSLGIAFQIYDDWLGIWGDEEKVGKSTSSDLVEKKKSLPILLGIERSNRFRDRFQGSRITIQDAKMLSAWLEEDGIEQEVRLQFNAWSEKAVGFLEKMACQEKEKQFLREITNKLLMRNK